MNDTESLLNKLKGKYDVPVCDGAGLLDGKTSFSRQFPVPPINLEAAQRIERLESDLFLARQKAFEECAQIAKSHRGKAMRYRLERGWKLGNMSAESALEVQSEERGGDIVAMEIYEEIQRLMAV